VNRKKTTWEILLAQIILFHDGCNICQGISATMTAVFNSPMHAFESVNLAIQKDRGAQAQELGITRLPSLLVDGRVMRLDDHSPIDHYV
jgi:hypothetical protein